MAIFDISFLHSQSAMNIIMFELCWVRGFTRNCYPKIIDYHSFKVKCSHASVFYSNSSEALCVVLISQTTHFICLTLHKQSLTFVYVILRYGNFTSPIYLISLNELILFQLIFHIQNFSM